jgi:hypothetical protein
MPMPGLSLVGFMERQQAINYLRQTCIPADPSDVALTAEWTQAQTKLGASFQGCGNPDIQEIPRPCQPYITQLQQQSWVQQALATYPGASFKVVEIDPLLAFQYHILTDHSDGHCNGLPLGDPNVVISACRHRHLSLPAKTLTLPAIAKCFPWKQPI